MPILATLALAASGAVLPQCSWDRPGANPFMGDVVAAVDHYRDIPEPVRAKLKARMQARKYDEIVDIRRDSISGRARYDNAIRDMHFGAGSVCRTVTRAKWADQHLERGLVYCEDGQCILVPTVCRNVSRITRTEAPARAANVASSVREGADPQALLEMEPTGAGVLGGGSPTPPSEPGSFTQISSQPPTPPGPTPPPGGYTPPPTFPPGGVPPLPPLPPRPPVPDITPPPVPEPGTWALMAAGLAALVWLKRRRAAR